MQEKPFEFRVGGQRLAGTLHLPSSRKKAPVVVMCHGFTGNRFEAHFLFVKAARALARAGIAAYRFDFRGSGESEGDFSRMTVPGEISDAREAVRFMGRLPQVDRRRIGILGLSLGGLVAANTAALEKLIRSLALWCPSAAPQKMFKRMAKWGRRQPDGIVDIGGLGLGPRFLRGAKNIDPVRALVDCRRPFPVLLLKGTGDTVIPMKEDALYLDGLRKSVHPVKQVLIDGAGHTFERLDHEHEAIRVTVDWFKKTL